MRLVLLLFIAISPVNAQWQRHVSTPKGIGDDTPQPHPLSYFTRYPALRDESGELCFLCSPDARLNWAKQRKLDRAEVKFVGRIRQYSIYDIFYFFQGKEEADWRSLVVSTEPGLYREIWHYQRIQGGIEEPSYLLKVGVDTLLGLRYSYGNRQMAGQEYFWFGKNAPVRMDFSPIWEAAAAVLPSGTEVWTGYDGRFDLPIGQFRVGVIRKPDWRCCSQGAVDVDFRLNGRVVVVTNVSYDPNADFEWDRSARARRKRRVLR